MGKDETIREGTSCQEGESNKIKKDIDKAPQHFWAVVVLFSLFLSGLAYLTSLEDSVPSQECQESPTSSETRLSDNLDYGLPSTNVVVIERAGYALGYNQDWKLAEWVSYRLTRDEALSNACTRADAFVRDPSIPYNYSSASDYARSGYDKGHLAPAADMHWSEQTMAESFYMSNMSPQVPLFNRGIWKRLETWVRDIAIAETNIFIITGPVVSGNDLNSTIGKNKVVIPSRFYKVILDETPPMKMIGFVMKNEGSNENISNFVVTVDKVEEMTGLDFFNTIPEDIEAELESIVDFHAWTHFSKNVLPNCFSDGSTSTNSLCVAHTGFPLILPPTTSTPCNLKNFLLLFLPYGK